MKIAEILAEGRRELNRAGVPDAEYDARRLLEHVLQLTPTRLMGEYGSEMEEKAAEEYRSLIRTRGERIPLQHILGETGFMGYFFKCAPEVLIPRPDTERLVEQALLLAPERPVRFLDLCTGSGCIGISFFLERRKAGFRDEGVLSDISPRALRLAGENARSLAAEVEILDSDLFQTLKGRQFDLILSNPPYISLREMDSLMPEVREHDPELALTDGGDGLSFYRRIISEAPEYLLPEGQLILEIGCDQRKDVEKMLVDMHYRDIACIRDYAGLDRVISARGPL